MVQAIPIIRENFIFLVKECKKSLTSRQKLSIIEKSGRHGPPGHLMYKWPGDSEPGFYTLKKKGEQI